MLNPKQNRLSPLQEEVTFIAQLRLADPKAFRRLVSDHQTQVYNTCIGFVHSEVVAEDLAQEVFMKVFRSIGEFKEGAKLSTWIYRIAVNKSLEYIRKTKRQKRMAFFSAVSGGNEVLEVVPGDFAHPGLVLENKEKGQVLFAAIAKLPEKQRVAFTLNKVEGLSYQEVSEVMKTSVSAVESLLFRARNTLKKRLTTFYKQQI